MSHLLKVKCVHRHPAADRTEPGITKVTARFEGEIDGTIAKLELTTTDPLIGAYCQVGKHYELPLQLDQKAAVMKENETA